jgi:hypothetical protein
MKNIIELELFGEDIRKLSRFYTNIANEILPGMGGMFIGNMPPSGWVAEIIGFDPQYKYARRFLKCKKDYSRSNSKGSRGIYGEYILESGHIYEVKKQTSWKSAERYYCIVNEDGSIIKISEEDVVAKLMELGHRPQLSQNKPIQKNLNITYYAAINMTVDVNLTDMQKCTILEFMKICTSKINKYLSMLCERMDKTDLLKSLETGRFAYSSVNNTHYHLWRLLTEAIMEYNYNADIIKQDRISTNLFVRGVELWLKNH